MRKTIQLPESTDKLLSDYLEEVKTQQGFKISKSSWVTQAIREKIARDTKKEEV